MGLYRRVAEPDGHRTRTPLLFIPLITLETSPGYIVYLPARSLSQPIPVNP